MGTILIQNIYFFFIGTSISASDPVNFKGTGTGAPSFRAYNSAYSNGYL